MRELCKRIKTRCRSIHINQGICETLNQQLAKINFNTWRHNNMRMEVTNNYTETILILEVRK
jgi:hypothetical protein